MNIIDYFKNINILTMLTEASIESIEKNNEPSKKVKCQIKYNHANINTAVITNPKVLQQWVNNAMLYTIKHWN